MANTETIKIYLKQLGEIKTLTEEEEKKFFQNIKKGGAVAEEARLKLIESNLPLVVNLAKKYYYPSINIDFLNFIEEGNMGLIKAVEKFDASKGFKFSTYAYWWIEKYFQMAVLKSKSIIQLPERTWMALKKIERITKKIMHKTGHNPDVKELAEKIDMSVEELQDILDTAMKFKGIRSLDYFIDDDNARTLVDVSADEEESAGDTIYSELSEDQRLESLIENLNDTEREVIKMRFGLVDNRIYSFKEVAEKLGIATVKVRDIQEIAIRKLRKLASK